MRFQKAAFWMCYCQRMLYTGTLAQGPVPFMRNTCSFWGCFQQAHVLGLTAACHAVLPRTHVKRDCISVVAVSSKPGSETATFCELATGSLISNTQVHVWKVHCLFTPGADSQFCFCGNLVLEFRRLMLEPLANNSHFCISLKVNVACRQSH